MRSLRQVRIGTVWILFRTIGGHASTRADHFPPPPPPPAFRSAVTMAQESDIDSDVTIPAETNRPFPPSEVRTQKSTPHDPIDDSRSLVLVSRTNYQSRLAAQRTTTAASTSDVIVLPPVPPPPRSETFDIPVTDENLLSSSLLANNARSPSRSTPPPPPPPPLSINEISNASTEQTSISESPSDAAQLSLRPLPRDYDPDRPQVLYPYPQQGPPESPQQPQPPLQQQQQPPPHQYYPSQPNYQQNHNYHPPQQQQPQQHQHQQPRPPQYQHPAQHDWQSNQHQLIPRPNGNAPPRSQLANRLSNFQMPDLEIPDPLASLSQLIQKTRTANANRRHLSIPNPIAATHSSIASIRRSAFDARERIKLESGSIAGSAWRKLRGVVTKDEGESVREYRQWSENNRRLSDAQPGVDVDVGQPSEERRGNEWGPPTHQGANAGDGHGQENGGGIQSMMNYPQSSSASLEDEDENDALTHDMEDSDVEPLNDDERRAFFEEDALAAPQTLTDDYETNAKDAPLTTAHAPTWSQSQPPSMNQPPRASRQTRPSFDYPLKKNRFSIPRIPLPNPLSLLKRGSSGGISKRIDQATADLWKDDVSSIPGGTRIPANTNTNTNKLTKWIPSWSKHHRVASKTHPPNRGSTDPGMYPAVSHLLNPRGGARISSSNANKQLLPHTRERDCRALGTRMAYADLLSLACLLGGTRSFLALTAEVSARSLPVYSALLESWLLQAVSAALLIQLTVSLFTTPAFQQVCTSTVSQLTNSMRQANVWMRVVSSQPLAPELGSQTDVYVRGCMEGTKEERRLQSFATKIMLLTVGVSAVHWISGTRTTTANGGSLLILTAPPVVLTQFVKRWAPHPRHWSGAKFLKSLSHLSNKKEWFQNIITTTMAFSPSNPLETFITQPLAKIVAWWNTVVLPWCQSVVAWLQSDGDGLISTLQNRILSIEMPKPELHTVVRIAVVVSMIGIKTVCTKARTQAQTSSNPAGETRDGGKRANEHDRQQDEMEANSFTSLLASAGGSSCARLQIASLGGGLLNALLPRCVAVASQTHTPIHSKRTVRRKEIIRGAMKRYASNGFYPTLSLVTLSLPILVGCWHLFGSTVTASATVRPLDFSTIPWTLVSDVVWILLYTFYLSTATLRSSQRQRVRTPTSATHNGSTSHPLLFLQSLSNTVAELTAIQEHPHTSNQGLLPDVHDKVQLPGFTVSDLWCAHTNQRAWATQGVSFQVRPGEILLVLTYTPNKNRATDSNANTNVNAYVNVDAVSTSGKTRLLVTLLERLVPCPQQSRRTVYVRGSVSLSSTNTERTQHQHTPNNNNDRVGCYLEESTGLLGELMNGWTLEQVLDPLSTGIGNEGDEGRRAVQTAMQVTDLSETLMSHLPLKLQTQITTSSHEDQTISTNQHHHLSQSEWSKILLTKVISRLIYTNAHNTLTPGTTTNKLGNSLIGSVLFLDNALTHYSETEESSLLRSLRKTDVATILTSSRWALGRFVDRVLIIDDKGKVIESGSHTQLLSYGIGRSVYAQQWNDMMLE